MAVNEPIRVAGPFVGDGVLTELDFDFETFAVSDISVGVINADDVETILTLDTDYTVTLNSGSAGGSVTLLAALATGTTAYVYGDTMPYTRTGNIIANPGGFFPAIVNAAFDRVHVALLQLADRAGRALLLPRNPVSVAGRFPVVLPDGSFGWSSGTGADDGLREDLAEASGALLTGFSAAGVGAVARTAMAKMRDTISDGDYTTLAQAATAAAGKTLLITTDRVITAPITLADNTIVRGAGGKVAVSVGEVNAFVLGEDCALEGLEIAGPANEAAVADFTKGNGVYASGKRNVRIEGCYIHGWNACGVQLRDCENAHVSGNLFHANYRGNATAGDIVTYSLTAGRRTVITGNMCLSNNSQGIYFNAIGLDADCVISNNICVALDPDTWAEYAMPTVLDETVRRHGIITSYAGGGGEAGRVVISGNICRNTLWSGIYAQNGGGTSIPLLVSGNICSKNGYQLGNSLAGGIYLVSAGSEHIVNNLIADFMGDTTAAIYLDRAAALSGKVSVIEGNHIVGSAAAGIACGTLVSDTLIRDNTILSPAGRGIDVLLAGGEATLGGFVIERNHIRRTAGNAIGINYNPGSGTRRSVCRDNMVIGHNGATANDANIGINMAVPYLDVTGNDVRSVYYGIHFSTYLTQNTRYFNEFLVDRNTLTDCAQGVCLTTADASSTFPIEGNIFRNCAAKLGGGISTVNGTTAARIGYRLGDKLVVTGYSAAPATGTWAVGDRAQNDTPAAAGAPGWYCTTAGTPGTWKAEGNLAA